MKRINKIILFFGVLVFFIFNANAVTNYDFQNGTIPGVFSYPASNNNDWEIKYQAGNKFIRTKSISNNQQSAIVLANAKVGAGNISFDYYTSTEAQYDVFNFYINGQIVYTDSGVQNTFQTFNYPVNNGVYTFKWEYVRDANIGDGENRVYLDNIIYNDYINQTQNNSNTINPQNNDFIVDYSPKNLSSINNYINFQIELNKTANCKLYINNNLETNFTQRTSFSYDKLFGSETKIKYYWYCQATFNNTIYYQKTNIENLDVYYSSNNVNFILYDQLDNLIYGDNLYLVTPCLKEYVGIYQTTMNQNTPHYFQKLNNGEANFNLSYTNKYNFCLIRGQINYKDNDYTQNFDLVQVNKQLNLGDLYVKNNTYNYVFRINDQDLKNVFEPSFWGKTWADLFNLIIALILGGSIITLGIILKSDKIVIGGVIILITGMGVSTLSLVGGILF